MRIKTAAVSHIYSKEKINLISEDQIKFALNLPLIDELMAQGAIKYTKEIDECTGGTKVSAEIKFIIG